MSKIVLEAIGKVCNGVTARPPDGWGHVRSEVVIDELLSEHLEGLEEFSHIVVVCWMHRCPTDSPPPTKVHPCGRADLPLVGLFASRAQHRPNSLGITVVKLEERRGNVLWVTGLDAIDGTPVIDIKPYMPLGERPENIRLPAWVAKLQT